MQGGFVVQTHLNLGVVELSKLSLQFVREVGGSGEARYIADDLIVVIDRKGELTIDRSIVEIVFILVFVPIG